MATLRAQLKPAQLAAALQLAGVSQTSRSPVPALPAAGSDAAARKALHGTGLLDAGRDGMTDATKAAFAALADPRLMIAIMANRAARPEWAETMLLTRGSGQPFVAYAGDASGGGDVAILPSPAHVLALIDELACLTHLPAVSGGDPFELDVPGFAAAAAAVDLVQEAKLEGMLDRRADDRDEVVLTAAALEEALARGMAASDPRWLVDAARAVSPPVFAAAAGRMSEGLTALQAAGLVTGGRSATLTASGAALAASLGRLVASSGFTIAGVEASGEVGASQLGILRSVDAIWMAAWSGLSATDGQVTLYQASTTTALRLMEALVDPLLADGAAAASPAAPRATARRRASKAAAGTKRAARSTAAAAAPAPAAAAAWVATHAVPTGGMPAWSTPDGSQAAVATLDAGLPVQVVEESVGWAHIVCSNGWEAWVDASQLVPA